MKCDFAAGVSRLQNRQSSPRAGNQREHQGHGEKDDVTFQYRLQLDPPCRDWI